MGPSAARKPLLHGIETSLRYLSRWNRLDGLAVFITFNKPRLPLWLIFRDADKCEQCPEDEWPNLENTACVKRPVDFLSFYNILGLLLTSLIVILFVFSIIILVIFIKHRETPIVKANNRNLSYTIIISLMLCFLCSLLFIGNPDKLPCLLQNIIFNLVFAVALSSILAKTITVVFAFNVTKPNIRFQIFFRKMTQVFCCVGEFSICMCWIQFYPPYPDRDSVSKPGILILHCNVGSHAIFYLALGYNSFLALLCFLVAYFAKKLPDRFNEAHHIAFSMLVFCSVWISFIPVYISTKGKYMMAVQVFAILSSSGGLLGFIFFPKCLIIIFRPKANVKQSLYVRKALQQFKIQHLREELGYSDDIQLSSDAKEELLWWLQHVQEWNGKTMFNSNPDRVL
ncbi:vomeronasal type-2 receptor 26-like [Hyla sarda]|uniref:vomeronasal type-2 receptor 26-like n=1 Tax=Hyla sarda TaxID=327740 RepID=UPI0024C239CF|nr:vomeronasal type-2 receptor 26-like [Hyla sarda]